MRFEKPACQQRPCIQPRAAPLWPEKLPKRSQATGLTATCRGHALTS